MQGNVENIQYAGFWVRLFASLLDSILQLIVFTPLIYLILGPESFTLMELVPGGADLYLVTTPASLISNGLLAVAIVLFWKYRSATPGKMMMGIVLVDAGTGGKPATGKLIVRLFGYIASLLPLCLGFLWIAFDRRKQGFHDKLANTLVIRVPAKPVEPTPE